MTPWLTILLFSTGALLLFVVAMSLTLMIKGHHIDGEISTNRHMRARGITCAVHDTMAANRNAANQSTDCPETPCAEKSCTTCTN